MLAVLQRQRLLAPATYRAALEATIEALVRGERARTRVRASRRAQPDMAIDVPLAPRALGELLAHALVNVPAPADAAGAAAAAADGAACFTLADVVVSLARLRNEMATKLVNNVATAP